MNSHIKYTICTILVFLSLTVSKAQQTLTLEQCRELALNNNKAIAIAQLNQEKSRHTEKAYRTNYLPKLSLTGYYLYTGSSMNKTLKGSYLPTFVPDPTTGALVPNILTDPSGQPVIGADGNPVFREYAYFPDMNLSLKMNGTWTAGLSLNQPIYTGGKITSAYQMSKIGTEIAGLQKELTREEVIVKVDEAYWTFMQTQALKQLATSYHKVVTELLKDIQRAQAVGLKSRNDVLKVQVKLNEAELQMQQADNGSVLAGKNLCYLTGLPLSTSIALPDMASDSITITIDRMADYTNRPEYAMLDKQIALKAQEIKLVRSDFLPQIGVMAHYGYTNGISLNGDKLLNKASFSAIASVSIPLFQWGEGKHKLRAARAEQDKAKLQRDDIAQQMELELAQAIDKCNESVLEVQLTKRSLEQANENMKISSDHYRAGMETLANYLEAQTVWQQAHTAYIQAQTRQRLNRTYYLKAAGRL